MPMTQPLIVSASGMRRCPTHAIIDEVMRSMPPVCLSASAMTDPCTMTTAENRDEQGQEHVPFELHDRQKQERDDGDKTADRRENTLSDHSDRSRRTALRSVLRLCMVAHSAIARRCPPGTGFGDRRAD